MTDLRYAVRTLLRTPAFTLTATLTLALGIGATTAMFSIVNGVLLRPLPYREPDQLVVTRLSLPDYHDVQRSSRSFEQTAVWASNLYNLESADEARQVLGGVISRDLLPLLGVDPVFGRNFTADDDRQRTVILGHRLWQSLFAGDPAAIGRTLNLSGTSYVVVGIAPPGFAFPTNEFQLWTPIGLMETDAKPQAGNRALRIFTAIGRLRAGVTTEQARGELQTISSELARVHPATNADVVLAIDSLRDRLVGEAETPLLLLLATVALVLLIACANVANLMMARAAAREREIAIRTALGAGRRRLLAQLAVESLVLAAIGGGGGLLLAMWAIDLMPAALLSRIPRADAVLIDGNVLLVAAAATLVTSLLFGAAPALRFRLGTASLNQRGASGGVKAGRLRAGIVVVEVALAVMVVAGAGLLVRSFVSLTTRDPGFVPDNVLSVMVQFVKVPDVPSRGRVAGALMDRLAQAPGVEYAGGATGLPAVTPQRGTRFEIEGRTLAANEDGAYFMAATPDYFRAVGTPLVSGRTIERRDRAGAQPVAVISRTLASTIFPGQDPVGRRLRVVNPEYPPEWRTIVGVVGDVQYQGLDGEMQPAIYTPFDQTPFMWLYVMLRTSGDTSPLTRSVRAIVGEVDPRLSAADVRPMTAIVWNTVAEPRLSMLLVSGFGALALALAAVGIYGVIAYMVSQRTREIGVRMALGAARSDVLGMVLREGLLMAALGVAIGLGGALLATRQMADLLVGITPRDPLALAAAAGMLLLVGCAASYVPARRATRVDPMVALRVD